jgi:hypothetical protein
MGAADMGATLNLHGANAGAEESGAENPHAQHHGQDLNNRPALLGVEQACEQKEEDERE